jgi:hypothetical protein
MRPGKGGGVVLVAFGLAAGFDATGAAEGLAIEFRVRARLPFAAVTTMTMTTAAISPSGIRTWGDRNGGRCGGGR